ARRIALNARVTPLLLGDGHLPLYLGRAVRFATPAQRQVLEALNPTCAVQGCEVPGTLCEVDHVTGWALDGGRTDIDNLTLTCAFHNRYKAANPTHIHITTNADGRHTYRIRAAGDPPPPATDLWNRAANHRAQPQPRARPRRQRHRPRPTGSRQHASGP
ncbi:HNH endonuclease, partial [Actinomadura sp. GC306]